MRLQGFLGTSDDEFAWAMEMNFFTTLRAMRAAVPHMIEQASGAIVNVASVNAFFQPDAGTIDYGAAKAAVVNLTKSLSQELGPPRHPRQRGVPRTRIHRSLARRGRRRRDGGEGTGVDPETAKRNVIASIGGFATGRFTTPEEVATLVVFLASPRTANITGANYIIDGGLIKTT
jgi:NAD(P)-dependent dehydrogenase (short-subunit alcohol dehydrogenase family)